MIASIFLFCATSALGLVAFEMSVHPAWAKKHKRRLRFTVAILTLCSVGLCAIQAHQQSKQEAELESFTRGGEFPVIKVEPYFGPTEGLTRTLTTSPAKPGVVAVFVENTNKFPIYDLSVALLNNAATTNRYFEFANEITSTFTRMPVLLHGKVYAFLIDPHGETNTVDYTFYVETRSRNTAHHFQYVVVSNRWEYSNCITEQQSSKIISQNVSRGFRWSR